MVLIIFKTPVCLVLTIPVPSQYTEKEGLQLGLVGWVKNTYSGTVVGQVQGPADMVEEM